MRELGVPPGNYLASPRSSKVVGELSDSSGEPPSFLEGTTQVGVTLFFN